MKIYKTLASMAGAFQSAYRLVIPSADQRLLKQVKARALRIDAQNDYFSGLNDAELKAYTHGLKSRLAKGETLDDILETAFAVVRETAWRVRGEKPYIAQLMGGIILHQGMIAEMGTGEGKTLVATLPAYLNALTGKGVHVITVNDYLAKRDAQNMGAIFEFLGLTVGCLAGKGGAKAAYDADITYGTNHDFVFDYLRDNMAKDMSQVVQRDYNYAIIDEIDNILIDEARTPCIISGEAMDASELCRYADYIISQLEADDFEKDEKSRNAHFTEKGLGKLDEIFRTEGLLQDNETIFDEQYVLLVHHLNQALKARHMFNKGVQYIVRDDEVLIVDEFTGRIMDGRRFSDGLHQALEAKENVDIKKENQTLATITYQKFFELYPKKSGMTGTAATESEEFEAIYNLRVVPVPPNKKSKRKILDDRIYRTLQEKVDAVVEIVKECLARKQPILIGTASVEKSELFSNALTLAGIEHQVLNAKNHAREADIIAQAGVPGAVTIATNMAGRGTDIKLGGSLETLLKHVPDPSDEQIQSLKDHLENMTKVAREAGGLFVLGTERHESRRIDNQLVGRCARQGDEGTALFVVSLEDPLMQIFGGTTLNRWLGSNWKPGEVIEHPLVSRAMSKAQKKVEAFHFDSRKEVLKYDSVVNDQSKVVYRERKEFMTGTNVREIALAMIEHYMHDIAVKHFDDKEQFIKECALNLNINVEEEAASLTQNLQQAKDDQQLYDWVYPILRRKIQEQQDLLGEEYLEYIAKDVCLSTLDMLWRQHLTSLENLRAGIGLKSYGQQDPLNEFKKEAFSRFEDVLFKFRETVANCIMHHKPASYLEQGPMDSEDDELTYRFDDIAEDDS